MLNYWIAAVTVVLLTSSKTTTTICSAFIICPTQRQSVSGRRQRWLVPSSPPSTLPPSILLRAEASSSNSSSKAPATTEESIANNKDNQKKQHRQDDESDSDSSSSPTTTQRVETFLSQKFPSFYSLLQKNDDIWTTLRRSEQEREQDEESRGFTLFAPNEDAFHKLGDRRLQQLLRDDRNLEVAQKMAAYHVVRFDTLTATQLRTEDWTGPKPKDGRPRPFTVGGILTMGGEVPVGRSKTGGLLFGLLGTKEDGDAIVGPNARIIKSYTIPLLDVDDGDGGRDDQTTQSSSSSSSFVIVHEMDGLIAPELLWRYCDQLRIPGF